jgi:hypothetical protein
VMTPDGVTVDEPGGASVLPLMSASRVAVQADADVDSPRSGDEVCLGDGSVLRIEHVWLGQ